MRLHAMLIGLVVSSLSAPAAATTLEPRPIPAKAPVRAIPLPPRDAAFFQGYELQVKFVDVARVRPTADGRVVSRAGAELAELLALADDRALRFAPLNDLTETEARALEQRAAARSGEAQPDLKGFVRVTTSETGARDLEAIGDALLALPVVEFAEIVTLGTPPPGDIAPATPNLFPNQAYHGPNPGLDFAYAWTQGATGAGVRISDCEYNWNPNHEDLVDINLNLEPGQTPHPSTVSNGWDAHGTAVVGETSAVENGYGCTGLAKDADVYTFPEWTTQAGFRRVAAVTNAINQSSPGDVVLLEMQTVGAGNNYGPAELNFSIHAICKVGTAAGVVVVGAAGNGNENLDESIYSTYMGWGDSGAIIVGAGSSSSSHDKLSFSTYGSRVNVQGWGQSVFTLGYGGFAQYGGDKNQRYTSSFSGTSSASPFIASACAALQDVSVDRTGALMTPAVLRQLLIDTGIAQGSGGHIGPFPDMRAAVDSIGCGTVVSYGTPEVGSFGTPAVISASGGSPSIGNPGFSIDLTGGNPNSFCVLFSGLSQGSNVVPWGTILVAGPSFIRTYTATNGQTDASVAITISPSLAGVTMYYQYAVRDPGFGGNVQGSDGLAVTFCP